MKNNFALAEDEKIITEIRHSIFPFIAYWLLAVVFSAAGAVMWYVLTDLNMNAVFAVVIFAICALGGIIIALLMIFSLSSERLILTNKRVLGTKGFLARRTTEIVLDKADAVTVSNSFMGAIFKYSSVNVVTPGLHTVSNGTTVGNKFGYVINAVEFSTAFTNAVEANKSK